MQLLFSVAHTNSFPITLVPEISELYLGYLEVLGLI